jgi:hypothetical protein
MDVGLAGKMGRVITKIEAGQAGEVMLPLDRGGSQAFPARAFDPKESIEEGAQVWVEEQNGRTVYVTTK